MAASVGLGINSLKQTLSSAKINPPGSNRILATALGESKMNINIHDVTDITIENVRARNGTTWRSLKIKGKGGVHEVVLFAAMDDPENLEITLGEKQ